MSATKKQFNYLSRFYNQLQIAGSKEVTVGFFPWQKKPLKEIVAFDERTQIFSIPNYYEVDILLYEKKGFFGKLVDRITSVPSIETKKKAIWLKNAGQQFMKESSILSPDQHNTLVKTTNSSVEAQENLQKLKVLEITDKAKKAYPYTPDTVAYFLYTSNLGVKYPWEKRYLQTTTIFGKPDKHMVLNRQNYSLEEWFREEMHVFSKNLYKSHLTQIDSVYKDPSIFAGTIPQQEEDFRQDRYKKLMTFVSDKVFIENGKNKNQMDLVRHLVERDFWKPGERALKQWKQETVAFSLDHCNSIAARELPSEDRTTNTQLKKEVKVYWKEKLVREVEHTRIRKQTNEIDKLIDSSITRILKTISSVTR
jgi:hypothetical protein